MTKVLLTFICMSFANMLFATDFITRWNMSNSGGSPNSLMFDVETSGMVSYTWETIPAGLSGSGTIIGNTATISGLPSGATIRLHIDATNFNRININYGTDKNRLVDIEQWGSVVWSNMETAFAGCQNLNITAIDIPNLSQVSYMTFMFHSCANLNGPSNINSWNTGNILLTYGMFASATNFNQPIGNWNTSNVIDMGFMFSSATNFNQPIGNWNTGSVISMQGMFDHATNFNQPIGSWNTGNVVNMMSMFNYAISFNQPIGNWNTGNVEFMHHMFEHATIFNQPLGSWNTGSVTNMRNMFANASSFNEQIGNWNTGNVEDMRGMFIYATSFNQPIDNWNLGNVTEMAQMFAYANNFNQPIGNWDVSNVVDMGYMFENASNFNQPIGNWNTGNVEDMRDMFRLASSFNQPIGNWNTSNVQAMTNMFSYATSFNQPLNNWNTSNVVDMAGLFSHATNFNQPLWNWNVSNVTSMGIMFDAATNFNNSLGNWTLNPNVSLPLMFYDCGMDCSTYSSTLNGWATNPLTPNGRILGAQGMHYSSAVQINRDYLINTKGWNIVGDALNIGFCCSTLYDTFSVNTCNSYSFNGQTLTSSGTYYDTLLNVNGCDSILTLNLIINQATASTINQAACNSYFFNGQTLTSSGTYYDTLMNVNGCDSLVTLNLTINNVNASVTQTGSTLTANATGAAYQWLSCPSYTPILGETNQIFTATANGDYAVEIIQNGCTDTSVCYTVIGIGMNETKHTSSFSVYPNPVNGKLVIQSSLAFVNKKKELFNSLGQLVFTTSPDSLLEIIDMSAYSKGIYYLKCENQVVKVVVD